jgi:hypothetical protein
MSGEVEANQQRSRRLYEEIFGRGNYAVADELMAADIVNHGPGSPPVPGTEGTGLARPGSRVIITLASDAEVW